MARAAAATATFGLVGTWTLLFSAPVSGLMWAHVIIFVALLANTFLSIRFYADIQPKDLPNGLVDLALFIAYIYLALSLGRPEDFAMALLFLFTIAVLKYALMLGKIDQLSLLRRKITIDLAGALAAASLLLATIGGFSAEATWTFAIGFVVANVYLLFIKPMYRL